MLRHGRRELRPEGIVSHCLPASEFILKMFLRCAAAMKDNTFCSLSFQLGRLGLAALPLKFCVLSRRVGQFAGEVRRRLLSLSGKTRFG